MPIILPENDEPDARTLAIIDVVTMIDGAMTGDEDVDVFDIAEEIVDRLQQRHGALFATIRELREWADSMMDDAAAEAPEPSPMPKPRIRVRAATQQAA